MDINVHIDTVVIGIQKSTFPVYSLSSFVSDTPKVPVRMWGHTSHSRCVCLKKFQFCCFLVKYSRCEHSRSHQSLKRYNRTMSSHVSIVIAILRTEKEFSPVVSRNEKSLSHCTPRVIMTDFVCIKVTSITHPTVIALLF